MSAENKEWVTVWGNAISVCERKPENYAKDLTLRYPVKMMLDGSRLRITLDNFCGNDDVKITSASIAESDGHDGIIPGTAAALTFGGEKSAVIKAGERKKSDAVDFDIKRGGYIAVSLYFGDFTEMRSAVLITGSLSKGYFAVGNQTESEKLGADTSKRMNWFYFLSDIEVMPKKESHTVICYGDSITAQNWPDYLMERVIASDITDAAVIRKAASGTRILRQYDNITYDSYGLKGEIRFPHETDVSGADTIIIQHGINDIIHPVGTEVNRFRPWSDLPTAAEMADGIRAYIKTAHEKGLKVYLGTLLPIEGWRTYADFREKLRNEFNDWIRTTDEADGVIDFDRAVRSTDNPSAFAEGYDSGDHLHPSKEAYKRMADEAAKVIFDI